MADQKQAIHVEIDPTAQLPEQYLGMDEDGARYAPMTFYEAAINSARQQIIGHGEKVVRELVEREYAEQIRAAVAERLPDIIEEAMTDTVTVGDGFSSTQVSIHDLIKQVVQKELRLNRNSYGEKTVLDKTMREQIDYALASELKEEVEKARAAVRKRVTEKAAELLAAESLRAAGIR